METVFAIIGLNLLVFLALSIRPDLLDYLALTPIDVWSHPWQLITSVFTHKDFYHIFANMFTLYFFGSSVMQLLGTRRFLFIYLLGGIVGSLFFVALAPWLDKQYFYVIGASGAVFSLGGALSVMRPQMRVMIFPIPAPIPLWIAVLGSVVLLSFLSNVAWEAHLGGLLFGAAVGYFYKRRSY